MMNFDELEENEEFIPDEYEEISESSSDDSQEDFDEDDEEKVYRKRERDIDENIESENEENIGAKVVSYQSESEMLLGWSSFVIQCDPDIFTGYIKNEEPRRSSRLKNTESGFRGAFRMLKNGNLDGFLSSPLIKRTFHHVWVALKNFGHGTTSETMTELWKNYWRDQLTVEDGISILPRRKCIACSKMLDCGHPVYSDDDEYFIGFDCYGIKLVPLFHLVDICKSLVSVIDNPSFETKVPKLLASCLDAIAMGPIKMKRKYGN
jgi:hypothetical protein